MIKRFCIVLLMFIVLASISYADTYVYVFHVESESMIAEFSFINYTMSDNERHSYIEGFEESSGYRVIQSTARMQGGDYYLTLYVK